MTAYFDQKRTEFDALDATLRGLTDDSPGWSSFMDARDALDRALVWDVTLAAESPGFPPDLREAIHHTVLRYSLACAPPGSRGPNYVDDGSHNYGLRMMGERLHDLFHALGRRRIPGYTDDPRQWLTELYGNGEERRERMVAVDAPAPEESR